MFIVISYPTPVQNEASLINQLFDEGLQIFHLRKPDASEMEIEALLHDINYKHHHKIALHQHHQLAKIFSVNRLHFTAAFRKVLTEDDLEILKSESFILSTSTHSLDEFKSISNHFDYAFLGPVFNSISKPDYKATEIDNLDSLKSKITKAIALGGITEENIKSCIKKGFDGVAVLGSIWESSDPVKEFRKISKRWLSEIKTTGKF
jgi:thiamine-phosphate pyrophosphorylase